MPVTLQGARSFLAGEWGFLSAHTGGIPTRANEVSGNGYSRAGLAWEASPTGVRPTAPPSFPLAAGGAWPEILSYAIRDSAARTSPFLAYVTLADGVSVADGERPLIARDLLDLPIGEAPGALTEEGRLRVYDYGLVRGTFLSFHSAEPVDGDDGELAQAGYARIALSNAAPFDFGLSPAPKAAYVNERALSSPAAGEAWPAVTHFGLWDAAAGGNLFYHAPIEVQNIALAVGEMLRAAAGAFTIDFTSGTYAVLGERAAELVTDTDLDVADPASEPTDVAPSRRVVAARFARSTLRTDDELKDFITDVIECAVVAKAGGGIEVTRVNQPRPDPDLIELSLSGVGSGASVPRYAAVSINSDFTAAEFLAGSTSRTRSLTVPAWPDGQTRYVAVAYPETEGDLDSVTYDASDNNQVGAWEQLADVTIAAVDCHVYRLYGQAYDAFRGTVINLGF